MASLGFTKVQCCSAQQLEMLFGLYKYLKGEKCTEFL